VNAVIRSRAVLVAIGIDWEGRRQVLGVEMANRESPTSWKDFLLGLKTRGLRGVIFVGSDDHPGLKRAIMEVLPEAYWSGGCRTTCISCAMPSTICHAKAATIASLSCDGSTTGATPPKPVEIWAPGCCAGRKNTPKLCAWVEENIEETFTFYRLPREHHKHLKSTNMLERINEELKRRTHFLRIFPNQESALRLIRALAVEIHEGWIEAHRKQLQLLEAA
jgi:putative transposase